MRLLRCWGAQIEDCKDNNGLLNRAVGQNSKFRASVKESLMCLYIGPHHASANFVLASLIRSTDQ